MKTLKIYYLLRSRNNGKFRSIWQTINYLFYGRKAVKEWTRRRWGVSVNDLPKPELRREEWEAITFPFTAPKDWKRPTKSAKT